MDVKVSPQFFVMPETPQRRFIKRALEAFRGPAGAFRDRGDGLGRPSSQATILGLVNVKISFKKLNFIFKMSANSGITVTPELGLFRLSLCVICG